VHLIAHGEPVGITKLIGDGDDIGVAVLEARDEPKQPRQLEPMGRHGEAAVEEEAAECSPAQIEASRQCTDRADFGRQFDDSPNEVDGVAIDEEPTPYEVVGNICRQVERWAAEDLG